MTDISEVNVQEIIQCFKSTSDMIREAAFEQVLKMPANSEICTALIEVLKQDSEELSIQVLVLEALKIHGQTNDTVKSFLATILHHESEMLRIAVAETFVVVGGDVNLALGSIVLALKSSDFNAQLQAVTALNQFSKAALPAARFLADMARDESLQTKLRVGALVVLYNIGTEARYCSSQITSCLLSDTAEIVSMTIYTLEQTGVTAEALPHLIAALNYQDPRTKQFRNRHVGLAGECDMHETVCNLLASLGTTARGAIPTLEEFLTRATSESEAKEKVQEEVRKYNEATYTEIEASRGPCRRAKSLKIKTLAEEIYNSSLRFTGKEAQEAAQKALTLIKETKTTQDKK